MNHHRCCKEESKQEIITFIYMKNSAPVIKKKLTDQYGKPIKKIAVPKSK